MNVKFDEKSWEDYLYWLETDEKVLKCLNDFIIDIRDNPESFKKDISGNISRQINNEHRIICEVDEETIYIKSCR